MFVGPLPTKLSRDLGPDRSELRVDRQGRVSVAHAASLLTWTHDGGVHVAERGRSRLALADYYLWWAHRLHSYAHEVSGSGLDLHLAERAARRGLRELGRLAKVVEHLDKHLAAEAEEEG